MIFSIGVVFTFLMGSWSDRHGRKTPMAVPCFGYFCQSMLLLSVAYFHLHPAYLVASAFLAAMFGGWTMFFMGYNSYVGDHTTEENRSAVLAIGAGTFGVGVSVGQLTGTTLLKHYGFPAPFWLFSAMLFSSFVYILLFADEHAKFKLKPAKGLEMSGSRKACSFFEVKGIRDNWTLLRQQRTGNRRTYIYLLLGSYFLMIMCLESKDDTMAGWQMSSFRWCSQVAHALGRLYCKRASLEMMTWLSSLDEINSVEN